MVLDQDWRPKDLPSLEELFSGDEPITLFLPNMSQDDAWEFLPWSNSANVIVDFGHGKKLLVPSNS